MKISCFINLQSQILIISVKTKITFER
uniref:Uncharacterized protein n=1 Tax=Rhizophora mucronata TaxID=61149 RepID=A0A2P2P2A8_RHIMU